MASVLDLSLLSHFSVIFVMVLVAVVMYAILQFTKAMGDNKGVHILIAIIIAIIIGMFPDITEVITIMVPWFVVVFIFILLILIGNKMFGASDQDILAVMKNRPSIAYWIIILGVIIFLSALGKVYFTGGPNAGTVEVNESGTVVKGDVGTEGESAFWATLFHPRVLGLILVLLVAVFTMTLLTSRTRLQT